MHELALLILPCRCARARLLNPARLRNQARLGRNGRARLGNCLGRGGGLGVPRPHHLLRTRLFYVYIRAVVEVCVRIYVYVVVYVGTYVYGVVYVCAYVYAVVYVGKYVYRRNRRTCLASSLDVSHLDILMLYTECNAFNTVLSFIRRLYSPAPPSSAACWV